METDMWFPFQDQGVSGTKVHRVTPFKYTDKMPPPNSFSKYTNDKSGKFAIAKSIQQDGIKPHDYMDKFDRDSRLQDLIADFYLYTTEEELVKDTKLK